MLIDSIRQAALDKVAIEGGGRNPLGPKQEIDGPVNKKSGKVSEDALVFHKSLPSAGDCASYGACGAIQDGFSKVYPRPMGFRRSAKHYLEKHPEVGKVLRGFKSWASEQGGVAFNANRLQKYCSEHPRLAKIEQKHRGFLNRYLEVYGDKPFCVVPELPTFEMA
ncbi:MAG: hypothetical protein KDD62_06480 [Bdellovibrionales bacterium]|nr:hypothetical protein [Bdellovibrionales bacterium]